MNGHQSKPWRFKIFHLNRQELALQMIIERNVSKVKKKSHNLIFSTQLFWEIKEYN